MEWTTDPETGQTNSSVVFKEIQEAIVKVLDVQIPKMKPDDKRSAAWIILSMLAAKYKMVPLDLVQDENEFKKRPE